MVIVHPQQQKETVPYIMTILSEMNDHMKELDEKYSLIFYEALGNLINAE